VPCGKILLEGKYITLSTAGKWDVIKITGAQESVSLALEGVHVARHTVADVELSQERYRFANWDVNVHGTVHRQMCILYNQRDATYTMFFIIISALRVSGSFSAHHKELIKLYVQPWVSSCGSVGTVIPTHPHQR